MVCWLHGISLSINGGVLVSACVNCVHNRRPVCPRCKCVRLFAFCINFFLICSLTLRDFLFFFVYIPFYLISLLSVSIYLIYPSYFSHLNIQLNAHYFVRFLGRKFFSWDFFPLKAINFSWRISSFLRFCPSEGLLFFRLISCPGDFLPSRFFIINDFLSSRRF